MSDTADDPSVVKVTMNMRVEDVETVKRLAKTRHTNRSIEVARAVRTLDMLTDAMDSGGRVLIEDPRGNQREVLFT